MYPLTATRYGKRREVPFRMAIEEGIAGVFITSEAEEEQRMEPIREIMS
jgi:hypothetical protein